LQGEVGEMKRIKKALEIYHVKATGEIEKNGKKISTFWNKNRNGDYYERVTLFIDGKKFNFYVHVLVCFHYHGKPRKKNYQVDHKKGPQFNGAWFIGWCSPSKNQKLKYKRRKESGKPISKTKARKTKRIQGDFRR
jgi:hypothetical protein